MKQITVETKLIPVTESTYYKKQNKLRNKKTPNDNNTLPNCYGYKCLQDTGNEIFLDPEIY